MLAEIALHNEESMMEDILREPLELTESELDEVAGGGGCEPPPHRCGCGIDIDVSLSLCLGIVV
jgi:hypothetical protein